MLDIPLQVRINGHLPSTTRYKHVGLESQMGAVAEISAIEHDLASYISDSSDKILQSNIALLTWQFDVRVFHADKIAILAQFRCVEFGHGDS